MVRCQSLIACFQIYLSLAFLQAFPSESVQFSLCNRQVFPLNMVVCPNLEMDLYHHLSVSLFTFHKT